MSAVRPWKDTDAQKIYTLLRETWLATYSSFIPQEDILLYLEKNFSPEKLRVLIQSTSFYGFVAEQECALIGMARTQYEASLHQYSLQQCYVHPLYQGTGIGTTLLEAVARHALSYHCTELWVGVMTKNEAALRWYKKFGYRIMETTTFTMGTTTVEMYHGTLQIDQIVSQEQEHTK